MLCILAFALFAPQLNALTDAELEEKHFTPADELFDKALRKLSNNADGLDLQELKDAIEKAKAHRYATTDKTSSATATTQPLFNALRALTDEQREDPKITAAAESIEAALKKKYIEPNLVDFAKGSPLAELQAGKALLDEPTKKAASPQKTLTAIEKTSHPLADTKAFIPRSNAFERGVNTATFGLAGSNRRKDAATALAEDQGSEALKAHQLYQEAIARSKQRGAAKPWFPSLKFKTTLRKNKEQLANEIRLLDKKIEGMKTIHTNLNTDDEAWPKEGVAVLVHDLHQKRKELFKKYTSVNKQLTKAQTRVIKASEKRQAKAAR